MSIPLRVTYGNSFRTSFWKSLQKFLLWIALGVWFLSQRTLQEFFLRIPSGVLSEYSAGIDSGDSSGGSLQSLLQGFPLGISPRAYSWSSPGDSSMEFHLRNLSAALKIPPEAQFEFFPRVKLEDFSRSSIRALLQKFLLAITAAVPTEGCSRSSL